MDLRPKHIVLKTSKPTALVVLYRHWEGEVVVRTLGRAMPMVVREPAYVTIPMEPSSGPLTQESEAQVLRNKFSGVADIYIISLETDGGKRTQGMVAVPKSLKPRIEVR